MFTTFCLVTARLLLLFQRERDLWVFDQQRTSGAGSGSTIPAFSRHVTILYLAQCERLFYVVTHEGQMEIIICLNIHALSLKILQNMLSLYKHFDMRRHLLSDTTISVLANRQVAPLSAY
jgi:hypothetical protein